jgi:hypothetical protein
MNCCCPSSALPNTNSQTTLHSKGFDRVLIHNSNFNFNFKRRPSHQGPLNTVIGTISHCNRLSAKPRQSPASWQLIGLAKVSFLSFNSTSESLHPTASHSWLRDRSVASGFQLRTTPRENIDRIFWRGLFASSLLIFLFYRDSPDVPRRAPRLVARWRQVPRPRPRSPQSQPACAPRRRQRWRLPPAEEG